MGDDALYRIIASRSLAVGSAGAAVASTTPLGPQTYAVELSFPGGGLSTSGCRFNIGDSALTVNSTTSPFLPPNWQARYKCTPGQYVAALSNDASAIGALTIVELSK